MKKSFDGMTRRTLWKLRLSVPIGSLFTTDYQNNAYHFNPSLLQDFFDGYIEYIDQESEDTGKSFDQLDNADTLYDWYCCCDYSYVPQPKLVGDTNIEWEYIDEREVERLRVFHGVYNVTPGWNRCRYNYRGVDKVFYVDKEVNK